MFCTESSGSLVNVRDNEKTDLNVTNKQLNEMMKAVGGLGVNEIIQKYICLNSLPKFNYFI